MAKKKASRTRRPRQRPQPAKQGETIVARDIEMAAADRMGLTPNARTVIYVHGIDNKPAKSVLRCQWDHALFGQRMGDRTRMAYWVDRERYPEEREGTCDAPDLIGADEIHGVGVRSLGGTDVPDQEFIDRLDRDQEARAWLGEVNQAMAEAETDQPGGVSPRWVNPLVGRPLNWVFRLTRRAFLADVHDFFFDQAKREFMLEAVRTRIVTGGGPFVIIGHSQGSMVAYEFLRTLSRDDVHVPLFVTIGSPLGLPPVRDRFRQWTGKSKLPFPPCVDRWVNVANRGDIVSLDTDLQNDIESRSISAGQSFQNYVVNSPNSDLSADRHSATGYLKTDPVRTEVRDVVGSDFMQPVAFQVIASDLVEGAERVSPAGRLPALIELQLDADDPRLPTIDDVRTSVEQRIRELAGEDQEAGLNIDHLRRFIAADLTPAELETLRTDYAQLKIHRIWQDMEKRALIGTSRVTIGADAANRSYQAEGQGITWAVLDTGIDPGHPHFARRENVTRMWDCTGQGVVEIHEWEDSHDVHGHGTHVAGIIAGDWQASEEGPRLAGMAPRARLQSFKVLGDNGNGRDSFIIKALDKIAELNESARGLEIHGVNLSLGGGFDPSVYGCGHTPLCNELRRLWRQGVVVVIAAGNEGYEVLRKASGGVRHTNLDLSIGDPANLEEAIAVGSVHRSRPHSYGISFFSSRGPTADGRFKPDVVAPGEKILSARSAARGGSEHALYVQASGTSMAAPHVSGILAAYLSIRREFIGHPDHLKQLLTTNCTDLKRDRYMQGAGMPNLIRMLAGT